MQRPERERKEPTEFNVIVEAKDLVKHTFTITNSTERYPKKYRFTLVNRIQDKAVDIYECVLEANELDLRDAQEYRQRQKLQAKALTYCKELLFFIELSQEMGHVVHFSVVFVIFTHIMPLCFWRGPRQTMTG